MTKKQFISFPIQTCRTQLFNYKCSTGIDNQCCIVYWVTFSIAVESRPYLQITYKYIKKLIISFVYAKMYVFTGIT